MADMTPLQDWINTALAGMGGAAATFFALRRRYSQDSTAIARDSTESKLLATLMAERDTYMRIAKEAQEQRMIDVGRIAHFEALMEAGERETKRLRDELFAMRMHTRKLTAIIVRLDPKAAQMLQLDSNGDGVDFGGQRQGPDTVSHV